MKSPKLKHTVLCQILLYLPGMLFFLWIIVMIVFAERMNFSGLICGLSFLLSVGISLWYLFRNMFFLMASDALFCMIRQWKKDRAEYRTRRNGLGRDKIQKTLLRRCALWGRRYRPQSGSTDTVKVFYRHGISWTVFWSIIEKRVAVCSTDHLTADRYRLLTGQARSLLSGVPNGKPHFKTKKEKKAPRATASVILILADTVADEVKTLARKPLEKKDAFAILPCVVQCSDGCYYTDCTSEYVEVGMWGRPAKNFAASMIRQIVFSRLLPKENKASQPALDCVYFPEMSLWEYCRTAHRELRDADDKMKHDRKKAFRQMHDGEVRLGDDVIWYKHSGRLAEYCLLPEENDEKTVTLVGDPVWYYEKSNVFFLRLQLGTSLNRKKMTKAEKEQTKKQMNTKLIAEGYRLTSDDTKKTEIEL